MDEGDELIMADIPGLIEGASDGRGLGHRFLRHVERARALCVLIDLAPTAPMPPDEQEEVLLRELEAYQPDLLDRPRVVVGSRADMAEPEVRDAWDRPVFSGVTGEGIAPLVGAIADAVREARAAEPDPVPFVVHRPRAQGMTIDRLDDGSFLVEGRAVERTVALSDITTPDALAYVQDRLRSLGVDRALKRAGAREGDVVHIGDFSFDYLPD